MVMMLNERSNDAVAAASGVASAHIADREDQGRDDKQQSYS